MRWPQLSLRAWILVTVASVATVVLILGAWAALGAVTEARARGRYLKEPFDRYRASFGARDGSQDDNAAAHLVASDPHLAAALDAGDEEAVLAAAERIGRAMEGTTGVEKVILSDSAGNTFPVGRFPSLTGSQWRTYRLFQDLRGGRLATQLAIIGSDAYVVAGAPIRYENRVVGTVLFARELSTIFWEIHNATDKTQRLALVASDRVVAGTTTGAPQRDALVVEVAREPKHSVSDGDSSVPVLQLEGENWDFYAEPLRGYQRDADPSSNAIGTLVLFQKRTLSGEWWEPYRKVVWAFGVAMVLALVVGALLAYWVTRRLNRLIHATEDLSRGRGDLTQRIDITGRDEIGVLADNLNRTFSHLHTLASGVHSTAFRVNASAGEISSISKQMLDGAREQEKRVSDSSAAVSQLSHSIQRTAAHAADAGKSARQSGDAVNRARDRLGRIRGSVEDAAAQMRSLGERSTRIGNIVEVIRQISEQTTMLALNAAIEAAHAGEHGRGFAVVADEVSSLAKRVGQSARDIEDLVASIRSQTGEAVRLMDSGKREVEEGTGIVDGTLADLQTLVQAVNETASSVGEQAHAAEEIARNMEVVYDIAGRVVHSGEAAVRQGDELLSLAERLEKSVSGFRIEPPDAAAQRALPGERRSAPPALPPGTS